VEYIINYGFGAVALALIGVGVNFMGPTPLDFKIAKIFFTLAAIFLLLPICTQIFITQSVIMWKKVLLAFILVGLIGAGWALMLGLTENREKTMLQQQLLGVLQPNSKPTPNNPCSKYVPSNAIVLLLGNKFAAYTTTFPHTVIQFKNNPLLIINKIGNNITLSASVSSADGHIVAEIRDNNFNINPNNYFRIDRPDYHTLIVYDQENNQLLNVEYINSKSIKFFGKFNIPNHSPIIINEDGVWISSNYISGCYGENNIDIFIE